MINLLLYQMLIFSEFRNLSRFEVIINVSLVLGATKLTDLFEKENRIEKKIRNRKRFILV